MRIYTRIGGKFFFVEALYEVKRGFGRVAELAVALHLQRSEVEEVGRSLRSFLLHNARYLKIFVGNGGKGAFALFLVGELALGGGKQRVAIDG